MGGRAPRLVPLRPRPTHTTHGPLTPPHTPIHTRLPPLPRHPPRARRAAAGLALLESLCARHHRLAGHQPRAVAGTGGADYRVPGGAQGVLLVPCAWEDGWRGPPPRSPPTPLTRPPPPARPRPPPPPPMHTHTQIWWFVCVGYAGLVVLHAVATTRDGYCVSFSNALAHRLRIWARNPRACCGCGGRVWRPAIWVLERVGASSARPVLRESLEPYAMKARGVGWGGRSQAARVLSSWVHTRPARADGVGQLAGQRLLLGAGAGAQVHV